MIPRLPAIPKSGPGCARGIRVIRAATTVDGRSRTPRIGQRRDRQLRERLPVTVLVALLALTAARAPAAEAPSTGGDAASAIARRSAETAATARIAQRSWATSERGLSRAQAPAAARHQVPRPAAPGLDRVRLERTQRYAALIEHHSHLHRVDADLVMAIVYTESGGDARARSSQGAAGLMQLMPATAQEYGALDPAHPEQSIASGTRYLRDLMDRFGSTELALWAYNAGPASVDRGHLPPETQSYIPAVLAVRAQLAAAPRTGGR